MRENASGYILDHSSPIPSTQAALQTATKQQPILLSFGGTSCLKSRCLEETYTKSSILKFCDLRTLNRQHLPTPVRLGAAPAAGAYPAHDKPIPEHSLTKCPLRGFDGVEIAFAGKLLGPRPSWTPPRPLSFLPRLRPCRGPQASRWGPTGQPPLLEKQAEFVHCRTSGSQPYSSRPPVQLPTTDCVLFFFTRRRLRRQKLLRAASGLLLGVGGNDASLDFCSEVQHFDSTLSMWRVEHLILYSSSCCERREWRTRRRVLIWHQTQSSSYKTITFTTASLGMNSTTELPKP